MLERLISTLGCALALMTLIGCRTLSPVSQCFGDVDVDGTAESLVIDGGSRLATGERYGERLLVYGTEDAARAGFGAEYSFDLSEFKPLKVCMGDVDGDGRNEIAICVYKAARTDGKIAKRPYLFRMEGGRLIPVWFGTRLSRPFEDFSLLDVNADGISELVAIERLRSGEMVFCAYTWKGFGFEVTAQSPPFSDIAAFCEPNGIVAVGNTKFILKLNTLKSFLEFEEYGGTDDEQSKTIR